MVSAQSFSLIILQLIRFSETIVSDRSEVPYSKNAIDNVTENTPHTSGPVVEAGYVFSQNTTWVKDGRRVDCLSAIEPCLSLCCPPEMAQLDGRSCVMDITTPSTLPQVKTFPETNDEEKTGNNFYVFIDNPCGFNWMAPSVLKDFEVLENGSIYASHYYGGSPSDVEHYCIFREPESEFFFVKACREWVVKSYWDIFCLFVSSLIMLGAFIGYTVVPELRNFNGLIFRSYVASYIATYLCAVGAEFTTQSRTDPHLFTLFEIITRYWSGCCAGWLNVMSFNVWRSFRWLRPVDNSTKIIERKLYIAYAIYAWIGPALLTGVCVAILSYLPRFHSDISRHNFKMWGSAASIAAIFGCNSILYISTAIAIRRHKKDTANLINSANKHYHVNKQWFNLHVKLFLIMGGHIIIWSMWLLWPTPGMTHFFAVLEVVQSILIFVIFLWKDNIKRSVCERVNSTLSRIPWFFGTRQTAQESNHSNDTFKIGDQTQ